MTFDPDDDDTGIRGCVYRPIYHLTKQRAVTSIVCSDTVDDEMPHACTAHADIVREMREAVQATLR